MSYDVSKQVLDAQGGFDHSFAHRITSKMAEALKLTEDDKPIANVIDGRVMLQYRADKATAEKYTAHFTDNAADIQEMLSPAAGIYRYSISVEDFITKAFATVGVRGGFAAGPLDRTLQALYAPLAFISAANSHEKFLNEWKTAQQKFPALPLADLPYIETTDGRLTLRQYANRMKEHNPQSADICLQAMGEAPTTEQFVETGRGGKPHPRIKKTVSTERAGRP